MKIKRNSDVLLINVPLDRTIKYREQLATLSSMPPLGQLYIATYLEKYGYRVSFIDLAVELFEMQEFFDALSECAPKIVGIAKSNHHSQKQRFYKERNKNIVF